MIQFTLGVTEHILKAETAAIIFMQEIIVVCTIITAFTADPEMIRLTTIATMHLFPVAKVMMLFRFQV